MPAMKQLPLVFWVLLLSLPLSAAAERRANAGDQAMKRMQYMMKQLQQDNQALVADKKKLDDEVADLRKDLARAKKDIAGKKASIARFENSNAALNRRIEQLRTRNGKTVEKLRKVIGKYRDLALLVRELKAASQQDRSTIGQREHLVSALEKKNKALFELNQELMRRYRDKGIVDAVAQGEPFSGLKQVQVENLLQEYRFRNEDNRAAMAENKAGTAR